MSTTCSSSSKAPVPRLEWRGFAKFCSLSQTTTNMLRSPLPLLRLLPASTPAVPQLVRHSSTSAEPSADAAHVLQSTPRSKTRLESVEPPAAENASIARTLRNNDRLAAGRRPSMSGRSSFDKQPAVAGQDDAPVPRAEGLAARLLAARKAKGALFDADAVSISQAKPSTREFPALANQPRTLPRLGATRDGAKRGESNTTTFETTLYGPGSTTSSSAGGAPRERTNRAPNAASGGSRGPPGATRAAGARPSGPGGPRAPSSGPRKPKRDFKSGSSPSMPSSSSTALINPTRYAPFDMINLAGLITSELATNQLKLVGGSEAKQADRLAQRQEIQGDYSRFTVDTSAKGAKAKTIEGLRRVMSGNSTMGLSQREFVVGKVEEALSVRK